MRRKKGAALKKAERFELAGQGCWYIFLARAVSVAAGLGAFLPLRGHPVWLFVGVLLYLLMLLAEIMDIYGLYVARDSHIGFHNAFWAEVIGGVALVVIGYIMIVSRVIRALWGQAVVSILSGLLSLCIFYCFSAAAKDLLTQKGDHTWARGTDWLRWGYGFWFVFSIAVTGISGIPALRESLLLSAIDVLEGVFSRALSVCTALVCLHASRSLRA